MPTGFGVRRASAALTLAHAHLYANTYMSFTIFQADATASKNFVSHPVSELTQIRRRRGVKLRGDRTSKTNSPK